MSVCTHSMKMLDCEGYFHFIIFLNAHNPWLSKGQHIRTWPELVLFMNEYVICIIKGALSQNHKVYAVDTKKRKVYLASNKKKTDIDQSKMKKDKKGVQKVFLDMDEGDVYDRKSISNKKSKVIGSYNTNSVFKKI